MITNTDGVIQDGYKVNDNKVIQLKIIDSPSFQFIITQTFLDLKENDRLIAEGLPPINASNVAMSFTQPELCAILGFLNSYAKDYYKAHELMVINNHATR